MIQEMSKKGELSVIYKGEYNGELFYVGSTIDSRRRWKREHLNPEYKSHGDFGKYIHKHGIANQIVFSVLEKIENWKGTRGELKKELRRREFLWKNKLPKQKFGKLDGLNQQPREVQRKIKNAQDNASRKKRELLDPEYRERRQKRDRESSKKNMFKNRERLNEYQRKYYAQKHQVHKPRGPRDTKAFCPIHAAMNKCKREIRCAEWDRIGRKYKPRVTREARLYKLYLEFKPKIGAAILAFHFL